MEIEIETVQYDYANKLISVTFTGGAQTTYTEADKAQYLADTGRENDVAAIGWNLG